jgi:hypothetical protein
MRPVRGILDGLNAPATFVKEARARQKRCSALPAIIMEFFQVREVGLFRHCAGAAIDR